MRDDVECPYCEEMQEINHDDGYGYQEDRLHEQECGDCGKTFTFSTSILYCYEANKADCLNGGKHKYRETCTLPRERTELECVMCDDNKDMTDEQMTEFLKNGRQRDKIYN